MAILLRIMCWNIAEASMTGGVAPNSLLPGIADQIRARSPDVVLLNEVKNWDLVAGGWMGDYIRQAERLAELTGIPSVRWVNTVRTGWTGHKAVAVLSRYPLGAPTAHPIMRGTETTGYATLETSFTADNKIHHVFSTRFDAHNDEDNVAAHQQSLDLIQGLGAGSLIIFGGDFNANMANDWQFRRFSDLSGLVNAFYQRPDPSACVNDPQNLIDHIFYRSPYTVNQMEVRCPWSGSSQVLSDHPWLFAELANPSSFAAEYRFTIKMKHFVTGNILHSHAFNYGHPGTSGQQQVTAFAGADDNDLWRVKGPHGQPEDFGAGRAVQHGDIIRLEHVATRRNLHSHSGFPSPVTGQQEVTCYGMNGLGDGNDNWRIEIEGGGGWISGRRVRLVHINTNHALHSHAGFSDPQWTMGQQEVTGFAGRDDNDWWYLSEVR